MVVVTGAPDYRELPLLSNTLNFVIYDFVKWTDLLLNHATHLCEADLDGSLTAEQLDIERSGLL
jgi:hypothetical protein